MLEPVEAAVGVVVFFVSCYGCQDKSFTEHFLSLTDALSEDDLLPYGYHVAAEGNSGDFHWFCRVCWQVREALEGF